MANGIDEYPPFAIFGGWGLYQTLKEHRITRCSKLVLVAAYVGTHRPRWSTNEK